MIHKLSASFTALLFAMAANAAHADTATINLPNGFTYEGKIVHNSNGSNTYFSTITSPEQNVRRGHTTITPSTTGGKSAIDHTTDYFTADNNIFHNNYTVIDGNGSAGHQSSTNANHWKHYGSLEVTASTSGEKSAINHQGSFSLVKSNASHDGKTSIDGNGSMSHSGSIATPLALHNGSTKIITSTSGGHAAVTHQGSFATDVAFHRGYTITDSNGDINHKSTYTGQKGDHTGSLKVTPSTSEGKSAINHEASTSVYVKGSIYPTVSHEGSTVTDGNGSMTHSGSITGPSGTTHEGSTVIVPSTTGEKPAINHNGSFTPTFMIR